MRYIGFGLILLGAYMLMYRQRQASDEEILHLEELTALFKHIERRVSSYFESPREWATSFKSSDEKISSALAEIRGGVPPSAALEKTLSKRKTRHGVDKTVLECISMLGGDDLESERDKIARASTMMSEHLREERVRLADTARVRSAMIALVALGAVIILV